MDIQRLRNLTTRRLHTSTQHIQEDIEFLTGAEGIMTHQLPNALVAMEPWLKLKVNEQRFWDDKFDTTHTGEIDIEPMTAKEQAEMFKRYGRLPSLLAGKDVVVVEV